VIAIRNTKRGIKSEYSTLYRKRLNKATRDFRETIDTIEVNKQLRGVKSSMEVQVQPSVIHYELEARGILAKLFFASVYKYHPSSSQAPEQTFKV
jgi:hypothetical protein